MSAVPSSGADRSRPVFVVSAGRSGSQMLAHALSTLPGVVSLHEPLPHLMSVAYLRWKGRVSDARASAELVARRGKLIRQIRRNGFLYIESSHYCSHLIPQLHEAFSARFVFLHRDPRAFTESGLRRPWWYARPTVRERVASWVRRRFLIDVGSPFRDHRLDPPPSLRSRMERIAWLWTEIHRVILRDLTPVDPADVFELPLARVGGEAFNGLIDFLRLDVDAHAVDAMLRVAAGRPNRGSSGGIAEWDEQAFERIVGAMAARLGYETT